MSSFNVFSILVIQYFQSKILIWDAELILAGDQGFLNSYYPDFPNSRVYEPDSPLTPEPETQRLSTLYNADVGLYMLANKWMVDEKELRVIHYTLGPLKPWDWFTAWLVKPVET